MFFSPVSPLFLSACERWNINESTLEKLWRSSEKSHKVVKFGGGFYCGLLECEGEELYVFNAFFMEMRSKFIGDNEVYFFSVEWEKGVLDWEGFRNRLLGPTVRVFYIGEWWSYLF